MANKHEKLLSELEFRMRQLMYLCDSLKEENKELKIQLDKKRNEIAHANAELEELHSRFDNLKFASALAGSDSEGVQKTKRRLSKLVQDIEKCISLLKV